MQLFETNNIAKLSLTNRLLMAPVKTGLGTPNGEVTDKLTAYYRRRAEGGVGAIIVEPLFVDPAGKEHPRQLGIDGDDKIAGLSGLVEAIHGVDGARAVAHLNHAGRAANPKASKRPPEAPSEMICPTTGATAQALSLERIAELIHAFGSAARRAREAGFDAVELQCGLGYLLAQFLSPRTNSRSDEYGGDAERRERFVREVVHAVRRGLGDDVPLLARLSATEGVEGGLDIAAAERLAGQLHSWGVSALHVVTGSACDTPPLYYQHMSLKEGLNETLAAKLKGATELPVIVAGRLGDPERLGEVVAGGAVDLVALGRPLVADPDLPNKIAAGHPEQVLACGSCLQGCLASVKAGKGIGCIVNPEVGHEEEIEQPADEARKVVIIGGGPAGLTAAIVAQRRGHQVTLLERDELGGQFSLAPLAPGKAAMERPLRALLHQATHCGADVRTGTEATADSVAELAPDVVILATGASPITLDVPGLEGALAGGDVLADRVETGAQVLVIGGGLVGIEVAEHLAGQGKTVAVVELLDEVARDMELITRKLTMKRLPELTVSVRTGVAVTKLAGGRATLRAGDGQEEEIGPFDSVVTAVGTRPDASLLEPLKERGIEVHLVGDAKEPKQIIGAVQSAWQLARSL